MASGAKDALSGRSRMTLNLQAGDSVLIGDVRLEMLHKSGRFARVQIQAPRHVPITRGEMHKSVPSMAECEPD